jgi:hypothetical protein
MSVVLAVIVFYLLFVFVTRRLLHKKQISLSYYEILLALGFKIIAGVAYGYIFLTYFGGDDTWAYHQQSLDEYKKMIHDPGQFFRDLTPESAIRGSSNIFQTIQYYIMDLETWLTLKILAVFNIFSRGNYYVNVVFFNALVFWGHYWLFSLLVRKYPQNRRLYFILIFFFPPVVFWLSGIRGDGLVFFFISLLFLEFYKWINEKKTSAIIPAILALLGVLIFRNMLVLLLLPCLISWLIAVRYQLKPVKVFLICYAVSVVLFFASTLISPTKNLPAVVTARQYEYFKLHGNTIFKLDSLKPNVVSFGMVLPQAINNSFLRPYPWEIKGPLQAMASLEVIILISLLLLFFIRKENNWRSTLSDPVILSFIFFGISLYIFIGYTVPFPGAIVRYKTIAELLLILVLASIIRQPTINNKKL